MLRLWLRVLGRIAKDVGCILPRLLLEERMHNFERKTKQRRLA